MHSAYIQALAERLPERDSLKLVKQEAAEFARAHTLDECVSMGTALYQSENFQIQEVGVLLLGHAACGNAAALAFLRDTVSLHESWKVQEVLAMAFDGYCRAAGYAAALPVIEEWLGSGCANVRRAASEGLRVWTSRPYFREHPRDAIRLLAAHRADESEYVRRSIGNALKDIGKKYPQMLSEELQTWDLSVPGVRQVHRLAGKFVISANCKEESR